MATFIRFPPDVEPFCSAPGDDKGAELAIHRDDVNWDTDSWPYFDRLCLNVEMTPAGRRMVPCDRPRAVTGNLVAVEVTFVDLSSTFR